MISVDGSVIIQIINFLFLILALNIILYRPIRSILIQRKEKIQGLEQKIDACEKDSREKDDAFAQGIKAARSKGMQAKDALLREAAETEKDMLEKVNQTAQENLAKAQKKIEADMDEVRKSLLKELDTLANIIGQKILGRAA